MKMLRYGPKGQEKPGCLDADGNIRDLSITIADFVGDSVSLMELDRLKALDPAALPLVEGTPRIGACLADVPNFYCVGLNYAQHAAESGMDIPKEPILFSKASSALSGPFDPVLIPRGSTKTDWEVELGVVIGKTTSYVSEKNALSYVAGYCTINDVSERAFQLERGGQWIKGKSAPTFGPIGPYLVTSDEIDDPQNLSLSLRVNGDVMQSSSTSDMVFGVAEIISHLSQFMVLRPGDIIATGTPEGVGMGFNPQRFLKAGDVMELEVEGLGIQTQTVANA
ncbi:2-hydroxyhepta-2,4-diene-1,7-dioate isomerase [Rhodobacterales bacterium 52_120_T64]|nr:2-hydroxyhepta-2,4-diene-1,7-dioate isomerase [Rhodobacterales bacterium 52_120_T64]